MVSIKNRIITGILLVAVVLLSLFLGGGIPFKLLYWLAVIASIWELIFGLIYTDKNFDNVFSANAIFLIILFEAAALILSGIIVSRSNLICIVTILLVACLNDTFAYFVGRAYGGKIIKLRPFPHISPKKSWEGIIGGAAVVMLAGLSLATLYGDYAFFSWLTGIGWLAGTFGDLFASLCKRLIGIKDAGECFKRTKIGAVLEKIMGSHGGYLDRIDSIAFVALFAGIILRFTTTP